MKSRDGKSQRREEKRREEKRREEKRREEKKKEDQKRDSLGREKIQVRGKVAKSPNIVFFQWFVAPEDRKLGSLKRRVRSQLARWEMKNCTPLWREARFEVKMYKTPQPWSAFRSCDVKKVHVVVARSTFRSQDAQSTTCPDHFWKLTCRKSAPQLQSTFRSWDVEKVDAVVARRTFRSQNAQSTPCSDHFWKLWCRKSARRCGAKHISRSTC